MSSKNLSFSSNGSVSINAGATSTVYTVPTGKTFKVTQIVLTTDSTTPFLVQLKSGSLVMLETFISAANPYSGGGLSDVLSASSVITIVWPTVAGKSGTYKISGTENASGVDAISVFYSPGGGGGTAKVASPTFSPAEGSYAVSSSLTVTLSCTEAASHIFYTTDGTTPTHSADVATGSTVRIGSNSGYVSVPAGSYITISMLAYLSPKDDSDVVTASFEAYKYGSLPHGASPP